MRMPTINLSASSGKQLPVRELRSRKASRLLIARWEMHEFVCEVTRRTRLMRPLLADFLMTGGSAGLSMSYVYEI
jgi:hypothetical protein